MKQFKNFPKKEDYVVVTLIDYKGSVPQALGAKALITQNGLMDGTVGGGKVEAKAIQKAQEILANKDSKACLVLEWNLTKDVGMTCGGVVNFLFELHRPKNWNIIVFGAGHVAQELVPMLTRLDCAVTCIDQRQDWLNKIEDQDNLTKIQAEKLEEHVKNYNSDCYFVLMTQGHSTDLPVLSEILKQHNPRFIGVIGSDTKALTLRTNLKNLDFSQEKIHSFHCPIGLKIGNSTPIEISHSVIAQLLQVRDGKS
jgi:xanthine dehydrogenase accessory factor